MNFLIMMEWYSEYKLYLLLILFPRDPQQICLKKIAKNDFQSEIIF